MIPTVSEARALLAQGRLSAVELVERCLAQIARRNGELNAFITVMEESALAEARERDREPARGPLHGVPVAVKDNIDTAGVRTTAGSALFADRVPEADAEVVRRLRAAGAIVIGKTNLQEFGLGSSSVDSHYGPVRNVWDRRRYAGGSSGGSACAVAAGMACAAVGTDTGGSIRTPAAYCGVVGLKGTYGRVPLEGIIPAKLSLDHCGPITRTVEDAALLWEVLAGREIAWEPVGGLRIGVPREPFFAGVEPEIAARVEEALAVMAGLTAGVREASLPATGHISLAGETFAYHEPYFRATPEAYTAHARRAIAEDGEAVLSRYLRSRWAMEEMRRGMAAVFDGFDVVVTPTRRYGAETVEEYRERDTRGVVLEEITGPFNVYGIPAVSVPCGFTAAGMPVGVTIAGPPGAEGRVLSLTRAYEAARE